MYRDEFATSHADKQPEEEEDSLRGTWYELYILDGCIAAFQRNASFRTETINCDVLPPCEDSLYNIGAFPVKSLSRNHFENSAYMNDDIVFSPFTYRIEAVRLLGRVLTITGKHNVQRERVQAI
jgi:hypothetical protein